MVTPYVTPNMIVNAPTGISWQILPFVKATSAQQLANQVNMCMIATGMVDDYCNHTLRSSLDREQLYGPDYRITQGTDNNNTRLIMSNWPVTSVAQIAVSPNSFPRNYTAIPPTMYEPEVPPITTYGTTAPSGAADGGQGVYLGAGYISWSNGRNGFAAQIYYYNGWPHAGTTVNAPAGTTTLTVDDVTGMVGANVMIYDGAQTESATVTAAAANTPFALPYLLNGAVVYEQVGPGTVTLSSTTAYSHASGTVVSAMPPNVLWAATLATVVQALESGITAATIQALPGTKTVGGQGIQQLTVEWETLLNYFRRTI